MYENSRSGFSMIGMLITMVCIVVLFAIGMNAMNKAITGQGSAMPGTVYSTHDMAVLSSLYQAMFIAGQDMRDSRLPVPSIMARSDDWDLNTTANLYSALIAGNYVSPSMLVSRNEYSPAVREITDYRHHDYDPISGVPWDTGFMADLDYVSHTSFAHMPLFGERYRRGWQSNFDPRAVLLGNRGPKDGVHDPDSYTYGRSRQWGGHFVYGDGRITFSSVFTPDGLTYQRGGQHYADNIFAMESGPDGNDAILSFTQRMTPDGPELQFD